MFPRKPSLRAINPPDAASRSKSRIRLHTYDINKENSGRVHNRQPDKPPSSGQALAKSPLSNTNTTGGSITQATNQAGKSAHITRISPNLRVNRPPLGRTQPHTLKLQTANTNGPKPSPVLQKVQKHPQNPKLRQMHRVSYDSEFEEQSFCFDGGDGLHCTSRVSGEELGDGEDYLGGLALRKTRECFGRAELSTQLSERFLESGRVESHRFESSVEAVGDPGYGDMPSSVRILEIQPEERWRWIDEHSRGRNQGHNKCFRGYQDNVCRTPAGNNKKTYQASDFKLFQLIIGYDTASAESLDELSDFTPGLRTIISEGTREQSSGQGSAINHHNREEYPSSFKSLSSHSSQQMVTELSLMPKMAASASQFSFRAMESSRLGQSACGFTANSHITAVLAAPSDRSSQNHPSARAAAHVKKDTAREKADLTEVQDAPSKIECPITWKKPSRTPQVCPSQKLNQPESRPKSVTKTTKGANRWTTEADLAKLLHRGGWMAV